jgi:hypothetical protein
MRLRPLPLLLLAAARVAARPPHATGGDAARGVMAARAARITEVHVWRDGGGRRAARQSTRVQP